MAELQKTLLLAEKFPPAIGGSCNMFASRAGLFPEGKVEVLAGAVDGDAAHDASRRYRIVRLALPWKGPRGFEWSGVAWRLFLAGFRNALSRRAAVIECARPLPEGVAGMGIALLLRRRLVVNFHGEDISVLSRYRVERMLLKAVIRSAHLNLANSRFTAGLVEALGGSGARVAVVHPGFNPSALGAADEGRVRALRARYGGGPILVTVGRIQRRKGQDNVIRALPALAARFPGIRYLVVGSSQGGTEGLGSGLAALAAELGVGDRVHVLGEVPPAELPDYFAAADCFVMPNREEGAGDVEGFGIVFLEAGSMGKPVIGGRSGGVPDAVRDGETGLLVDGRSVEEIASAVARLLDDPAAARGMGLRGREFAASLTHDRVFAMYRDARAAVAA